MILSMEPWHLISVVMHLRDEDVEEQALVEPDIDRQIWACKRALAPGLGYTVADSSGRPVACFGFLDDGQNRATAWLVATPDWCRHVKSIYKATKIIMREGGYRRIQAFVRPERHGAEKFLKWLGFKLDGPLPGMRADGGPMNLYSYTGAV